MIRAHEYPVVGTWYWDIDHLDRFEIVAQDEKSRSIEIQYFSGEIEEVDFETWFNLRVVSIAAPRDWSGPFEVDKEDFTELNDEMLPSTVLTKYWDTD